MKTPEIKYPYTRSKSKVSLLKEATNGKYILKPFKVLIPAWYLDSGLASYSEDFVDITAPLALIVGDQYQVVMVTDMFRVYLSSKELVTHFDEQYLELECTTDDPAPIQIPLKERVALNTTVYRTLVLGGCMPWFITKDLRNVLATTYFGR